MRRNKYSSWKAMQALVSSTGFAKVVGQGARAGGIYILGAEVMKSGTLVRLRERRGS